MGSPEIGAMVFENLLKDGVSFASVITQPDRPCGRGCKIKETPVKELAQKHNIKTYLPADKKELTDIIKKIKPDLCIVSAYGMIIPKEALKIPKHGMINFHPSLLPKYRGPSPIMAPILNGDKETGVTIIQVSEKMDAGDILDQIKVPLKGAEITPALSKILASIGSKMLLEIIPKIEKGEINPISQDDKKATYTKIIKKEDGLISWANQSSTEIERMSRAYQPWPGIYTIWNGKKIDLYEIKKSMSHIKPGFVTTKNNQILIGTQDGAVAPGYLKIEGKKKLTSKEFICGYGNLNGSILK